MTNHRTTRAAVGALATVVVLSLAGPASAQHARLVASDNNVPFSSGRGRSRSLDRSGPLAADDTELILVELGTPLPVDRRLLPAAAGE